jgi:hypothetical protein
MDIFVSTSDSVESRKNIIEWRIWNEKKKTVVAYMRSYPDISLEEVRNSLRNFSQNCSCPDRDSIQVTSKYNSEP